MKIKQTKIHQALWKENNQILRIITLLDPNVQFSTTKIQGAKRNRKVCLIQRKNKQNVPEKDLMKDLDKN